MARSSPTNAETTARSLNLKQDFASFVNSEFEKSMDVVKRKAIR